MPPLVALAVQLLLWSLIQPYVWFLFYPAVFISSWIGGFRAGLGATALSTLIVLWFFVPPTHALLKGEPRAWFPTVVFVAMGVLFSIFHERLRRSERRSRDSEAQARSMLESVRQGATVFEATNEAITVTDTAARIVAVNAAFSTITGFAAGEALGATPRIHRSGRQDKDFYERMWHSLQTTGQWQGEIWNRRKNGETYPAWENISAVRDADGTVSHYVSMLSDITALKQAEEQLRHMALHDVLTGLPNRRLLAESLEGALARAQRHGHRLALLFLDLDRFKLVNDTLGHAAGDELLGEVARRLRAAVRQEDLIARLGGDEFTVVLEELQHPDNAAHLARKLIEAVARPMQLCGRELTPSTSVGIAIYPDDARSAADLSKAADAAMYRAKQRGRHTFEFYTPDITAEAMERLAIENDLRRALARGELLLYFQPQVDLRSGRILGFEALLRWNHPERGLLLPDQFIPIAEECGLIHALGGWAIDAACAQARRWADAGLNPQRIAVNVSGSQLLHKHLVETVRAAMAEHRFTPGELDLELEITESVLQSASRSAPVLRQLRELGVRIAIDDFGTGYSSLGVLKHMPIDTLKIDRVFIRNAPDDGDAQAIAKAMIVMAHGLGLHVVAEGVETPAQCRFLLEQGCDEVQGHLYSPPLPGDEVPALMARRTIDVRYCAPTWASSTK
ncbi:MAG TPA: EAL domain-containing protein [Piscinibacter sp.]|nr:EAL domain-containing protein [Piscinibacter sp.]